MSYRGNHAKNTIETALQQHQGEVSAAEAGARQAARDVDNLTRELGESIEQAADLIARLDVNGGGQTGETLRRLLAERDRVRHETKDQLTQARTSLATAQANSRQAREGLVQAETAREHARSASNAALDNSAEWIQAKRTLETLEERSQTLVERHKTAVEDLRAKGPDYKHPVFDYLYERRFGEEGAVTGNALTRWMDS